ncbi:MAG: glycosyltransferase family 2 protein [Candidatus Omnitrophota bacterium]
MRISVIVPIYNSEATLEPCLSAIRGSRQEGDEIIVVDDGSTGNGSALIAAQYADEVIGHAENLGRSQARNTGIARAQGEVLLFVDSDVVVRPDTIRRVRDYFGRHGDVDALSGMLSKEHPYPDFFSQYKNLYMNYIFSKLPERVNFLYGSVHAVRRRALQPYGTDVQIADDTALGQKLASHGCQIAFLRDLDVVHLKKYDLLSFVRNDFIIPFEWTKIFIRYRGWAQLGRKKTGYLHSPTEQLASVALSPLILFSIFLALFIPVSWFFPAALCLLWGGLNSRFFAFLFAERGAAFGVVSVFVTFLDHLVMAAGILAGFAWHAKFFRWRPTP